MKDLRPVYKLTRRSIHIDWTLMTLLLTLIAAGLVVLFSASNENPDMIFRQSLRLLLAFSVLFALSAIPPHKYKRWAPRIFCVGLALLLAVMIMGKIGKGAQRWLAFAGCRFQPSEIMKLAIPLIVAWYLDDKPVPIQLRHLICSALLILIPALLIAKQPDLGTAIMVVLAGFSAIFLVGVRLRIVVSFLGIILLATPLLWHVMHDYQKQRIITLLNPEQDPLGRGYHIIQSKIAIGSGGAFGKGWLQGSQAHLNFLPEHATDFIFAVGAEEFGFIGSISLILLLLFITLRTLYIAQQAQTHFAKLLATSLAMTFFFSFFVNIGMVMGILPVVGIPLPLISYGGTAMVTFLGVFGVLMSISAHRILFHTR